MGTSPSVNSSSVQESQPSKDSDKFKARLEALSDTSTRFTSALKIGLGHEKYSEKLLNLQADFDLALAEWPQNELKKERSELEKSLLYCAIIERLWTWVDTHRSSLDYFVLYQKEMPTLEIGQMVLDFPGLDYELADATQGEERRIKIYSHKDNLSIMMGVCSERLNKTNQYIKESLKH